MLDLLDYRTPKYRTRAVFTYVSGGNLELLDCFSWKGSSVPGDHGPPSAILVHFPPFYLLRFAGHPHSCTAA